MSGTQAQYVGSSMQLCLCPTLQLYWSCEVMAASFKSTQMRGWDIKKTKNSENPRS